MAYKIMHSRGEAEYAIEVPTAKIAYRKAVDFACAKQPDVRVETPDGQTLEFEAFERLVRTGGLADKA